MKNFSYFALCVLSILLIACQKEDPDSKKESGSLHIDVGLHLEVNEVSSVLKSIPVAGDLIVIIYREDGTEAMAFARASDMPSVIELEIGNYYVEAYSDNNLPAEFENPYYYGLTEIFTISSNEQQSVQVNCQLANTIVSVIYSQNIVNSFSNYT